MSSPHEGQANPPNPSLDPEYVPQSQPLSGTLPESGGNAKRRFKDNKGNLPTHRATVAIHHSRPRQKTDATIAETGWYRLNNGALHGPMRHSTHSHTAPSPSPSRMYRYAGCPRRTGAIPCRLASRQVIRPLPLSS